MKLRTTFCVCAAVAGLLLPSSLKATVVMDQIGPDAAAQNNGTANACQDFEAANNAFDIAVIDDFTLTGTFQLDTIEVVFNGYGTGFTAAKFTDGSITGWRVEIYSNPAAATSNLTGNVASALIPNSDVAIQNPYAGIALAARATLNVTSVAALNLPAGTYWLAVIPVMNFAGNGQIGTKPSSFAGIPGNLNARQVNPGGGFGIPGNNQALNQNVAMRINATSAASIPPSLSGASNPFNVAAGDNVTLTVNAVPGENPPSNTLAVTVDLTQIGGAANTPMNDAGGNTFTLDVVVGPNPPCGNITLPATVTDDLNRTGNGSIPLQPINALTPTPGAAPDAEPDCGLPTDTVNGGCNVNPNVFGSIACGQTVEGSVRSSPATRDTDWYAFTLTQSTPVTLSVIAQSDTVFGFVRDSASLTTPPACGSTTLQINPAAFGTPCQCGNVSVTLGAGTWWAFVSTPFQNIPCGRAYQATLRCGTACLGDVNGDTFRDGRDVQEFARNFAACVAGTVRNCTTCRALDVNGDNVNNQADVAELVNLLLDTTPCP